MRNFDDMIFVLLSKYFNAASKHRKACTCTHIHLPCFSTSGTVISDTFEADFNELYNKQTIQMIKPTMLVLSNVI